jgi:ferredoxin-type protein NapF
MARRHGLKVVRAGLAVAVLAVLAAAFLDFRGAVPAPLAHALAAVQFVPSALALAAGGGFALAVLVSLAATLALGRIYCSVLCPLGLLQDAISRLAGWCRRAPLRLRPARPATWVRHLFLWSSVAAILAGWSGLTLALLDPFSVFGRIASGLFRPLATAANNLLVGPATAAGLDAFYRVEPQWAAVGALAVPAGMLATIAWLAAARGRLYCNTVCPVGTLLGFLSARAALRLEIDRDACRKCGDCLRACKAQCIDLQAGTIDHSRCVACYNCVSVCDEHGIHHRYAWGRTKETPRSGRADADTRAGNAVSVSDPRPASTPDDPTRRAFLGGSGAALLAAAGVGGLLAPPATRAADSAGAASGDTAATGPLPGHESSRGICPPGSHSVTRFLSRCTACQLCVSACPTHVLQPAVLEYGFAGLMKPRLDYTVSFCNFDCRRCAEVCPTGAIDLLPLRDKQVTRLGIARLDLEKCVVKAINKDCAACSEHCPTKAVDTIPYGDNLRLPQVRSELCIGCGACEFACPVAPTRAIRVTGHRRHDSAEKPAETKAELPKSTGDFPF